MWNSCTGVFPNTRAMEQQEYNDTKTKEEGKKIVTSMYRGTAGMKNKRSPDGLSLPIIIIIILGD